MSYIKFKKTKIVATLGPGCGNKTMLSRLIKAGVNVFRINFSHATYEEVDRYVELIRSLNKELDTNVAILADLQGPKIRVGKMEDGVVFKKGDEFILSTEKEIIGNKQKASLSYKDFAKDVKKGDKVLVDDGKLIFEVISTNKKDEVKLRNIQGGKLSSKKGVNLPNTKISTPSLTKKDKQDLLYAISKELDWVALSFVRDANDMINLRKIIEKESDEKIPIIAKIEKPEAIKNIEDIIQNSDGIMVARGDLGIEIPSEEVVEMKKGKKVNTDRKFFPGYMMIKMTMDDEIWHTVRSIPKVYGFLGGKKGEPIPVPQSEIDSIFNQMKEGVDRPKPSVSFEIGEQVRVSDGPFSSFNGMVEEVDEEKARLKVSVSIFGRSTPVDLDYSQVEKI